MWAPNLQLPCPVVYIKQAFRINEEVSRDGGTKSTQTKVVLEMIQLKDAPHIVVNIISI